MSDIAYYYALSQDLTKGCAEKAVLKELAMMSDEDNKCWPSYDYIARKCGCTKRTVIRTVKRLEERGLIHKERRQNHRHGGSEPNCFTILVPEIFAECNLDWESWQWVKRDTACAEKSSDKSQHG